MTQRSARSSIVFAGSFNQELISSVEQPVICVHSLFDVIGELATCSASNLVDAVVVDELLLKQNQKEIANLFSIIEDSLKLARNSFNRYGGRA